MRLSQIFRPGTVVNAYTNFHLRLTLVRRTSANHYGFIGKQQMTQALEEMKISVKIHLIWLMHQYICVESVIYCLGIAYLVSTRLPALIFCTFTHRLDKPAQRYVRTFYIVKCARLGNNLSIMCTNIKADHSIVSFL